MSTHREGNGSHSRVNGHGLGHSIEDNFNWVSEEMLKSAEDSLIVLKNAADRVAQTSLEGLTATSEETASYIATMMNVARANTESAMKLAGELASATRPSELIAITNAHANRQMELVVRQNRALWTSAQRLVNVLTSSPESSN